ncbi:MAG: hypothetical protein WAK66_15605 [Methylocystis sp.]
MLRLVILATMLASPAKAYCGGQQSLSSGIDCEWREHDQRVYQDETNARLERLEERQRLDRLDADNDRARMHDEEYSAQLDRLQSGRDW